MQFAIVHGHDSPTLPASEAAVLHWISVLAGRVQPKTIKSYLSHLRSLHVDLGLDFHITESPVVQRVIRGIKKVHGEKAKRDRLPITLAILRLFLQQLSPETNSTHCVLTAAYTLAFAAFMRCGEFTFPSAKTPVNAGIHLTRRSITFIPSIEDATHVELNMPASKTDPFRMGVTILVSAAPGASTCPVTALTRLYRLLPLDSGASLFERPGSLLFTRSFLIESLRQAIHDIGLDPSKYAGHSFRRGAATQAAIAGYSDHEIQLLGRWRSDAFKLYIDVPRVRILNLSSNLHLA